VIDMSTYANGKTNFEKFENARDEAAAKGGGVLYYPAGVYDFSEGPFSGPNGRGMMLRSGVVIRGAAPVGKVDSYNGTLDLPTKFVFGFDKHDDVALDTGTRARFRLSGGMRGGIYNDDLVLSIDAPKDQIGNEVVGFLTNNADLKLTGTATVKKSFIYLKDAEGKNADIPTTTIDVKLTLPKSNTGAEVNATYTLQLTSAPADHYNNYSGTYTGKLDGKDVTGNVEGKISTVKAETPKDWNIIGLAPEKGGRIKDVNNVGIVNVSLEGATVYFGPDVSWGATWRTAGSWKSNYIKDSWADRVPDGTHPADAFNGGGKELIGSGNGRLVVGCYFKDAAVVNNSMTCGVAGYGATPDHAKGFGADGFYMAKFPGRISVYGTNVLVAANVLSKSEGRNFVYAQNTTFNEVRKGTFIYLGMRKCRVLFDYNKTCGIDINKEMLGLTKAGATSEGSAGFFAEDVVVRDNYVFNNGHKGFNISGKWLTIQHNRNQRDFLDSGKDSYGVYGWRLTLDGFTVTNAGGSGTISDNLSRAFDLGGQNVWIDKNYYINTGSNPGNDGEGILCQAHGGTNMLSWAMTRNEHEKGRGQSSYMGGWDVDVKGWLAAWNKDPSGSIGETNVGKHPIIDCAVVENIERDPKGWKKPEMLTVTPTESPKAPVDVKVTAIEGAGNKISWTDASDNEIGFRVDRTLDGGATWTPIAYRPPHIEGTPENLQEWMDYMAPAGKASAYRVVACDGKDSDAGASALVK
ncbi:MAG: hypothetical protein WCJ56_02720, partial [bacterium]